jgi:hypothetical protein
VVHNGLGFFFCVPVLEKSFTSPFMGSNFDLFQPMESPGGPCDSDFEFEFEFGNTGKCASLDRGSSTVASISAGDGDLHDREDVFLGKL